jgi:hypothetical protein
MPLAITYVLQKKLGYTCKLLTPKVTRDLTVVAVFPVTYIAAYS